MPTVDDLLNNTIESQVCIIDPDTRVINVPACYKEFGVEADEKVNRIKFQCPKMVGDNIDLTTFNLYINYMNARGEYNAYLVDDVTVSGDDITFSWVLSRHVTEKSGTVNYIVCAKKSDETGVINEWNTKVATATVGVGLEATTEIEAKNADVIEQILVKLDSVKTNSFVINITNDSSGEVYSADKTYDEITEALNNGLLPVCKMPKHVTGNYIYGVCYFSGKLNPPMESDALVFNNIAIARSNLNYARVMIYPDNNVIVSYKNARMIGATSSKTGEEGYVPKPSSEDRNYFLRGDALWKPALQPPTTASVGQYLSVKAVADNGIVTETEAVDGPSTGDLSLGVTGATIGKTVKIASIDSNGAPTAWEPVDMTQEILSGMTNDLTPVQVHAAVSAGRPVKIQYTSDDYGILLFTAFNIAETSNAIVSQTIVMYKNEYVLAELCGFTQSGQWFFNSTTLAEKKDIPTVPSSLKNPNALTIKVGSNTVTYDGSSAQTVDMASGEKWEKLYDGTMQIEQETMAIEVDMPRNDSAKGFQIYLHFAKNVAQEWADAKNISVNINGASCGYFTFTNKLVSDYYVFAKREFDSVGRMEYTTAVVNPNYNMLTMQTQLANGSGYEQKNNGKISISFASPYAGSIELLVYGRY